MSAANTSSTRANCTRPHLVGPAHADTGWQRRAQNGLGIEAFDIDWDLQRVTRPGGKISTRWAREQQREKTVIRVRFSKRDCGRCPLKDACSRRPRRRISIQDRDAAEALRHVATPR
jgi:Transposase DDE domain